MDKSNVGKQVTWGKPPKSGGIRAVVPAGTRISSMKLEGVQFRRQGGMVVVDKTRFEEDISRNDRYLVQTFATETEGSLRGEPPKGIRWYAPKATEIDAALAGA